ncbi:MAG: GAF domain-containing protein [Gemmatimonadetes bacterium]|nr:GAF domain-containing protein [Gemmatimonadota bacterium]
MTPIRVGTLVTAYPAVLAVAGGLVLAGAVALHPQPQSWPVVLLLVAAATVLRRYAVSLSKFSYLSLTSFVGLTGSVLFGAAPTLLAMATACLAGDWGWLRKPWRAATINAGREVLALAASFGVYAGTLKIGGLEEHGLGVDLVPALVFFTIAYFLVGRALFYFTLLLRGKLMEDEQSLILRYEVVAYFVSALSTATSLIAVATLEPRSWPFVGAMLLFAGWMVKRLLEEAIGAEERTKVLAVDMAVTADLSLVDSLDRIARLANRLVDWSDLRIYRQDGDRVRRIYRSPQGAEHRDEPGDDVDALRAAVIASGEVVVVLDARTDPRVTTPRPTAQSLLVVPLRFGDLTIGTLELEHAKRNMYGPKAVTLVGTLATQVSSAIHIADLREPLVETVQRIGTEVRAVAAAVEKLRWAAARSEEHAGAIKRAAAQQELEVQANLGATESLTDAARRVASDGRDAAARSVDASRTATLNRDTIGGAVQRLVDLKSFVSDSSQQVRSLQKVTRSINDFIAVIRDIADQTNLLALNAAIEAARAGGHGRGFAVVADEVRRLADQSARAAGEASQLVAAIQQQMAGVVEQMRRGEQAVGGVEEISSASLAALEAIVRSTADATGHAHSIAGTAAEQDAALGLLAERIRSSADISRRNRREAEEMASRAGDQARELAELERSTRELEAVASQLGEVARRFANV